MAGDDLLQNRDSVGKVFLSGVGTRQKDSRFDLVRMLVQDRLQRPDRFIEMDPARKQLEAGDRDLGLNVLRIQSACLQEFAVALLELPILEKSLAELVMNFRRSGLDLKRVPVLNNRFVEVAHRGVLIGATHERRLPFLRIHRASRREQPQYERTHKEQPKN